MAYHLPCLLLVLTFIVISARHNKDEVRADLYSECDQVRLGEEIGQDEYIRLITAGSVDLFTGGGGAATTELVKDLLREQATSLGVDDINSLILDGISLVLGSGSNIRGGILTYNHEGWTVNCCAYECGNLFGIPCTGCSKMHCGETTWANPNTHQPYICFY